MEKIVAGEIGYPPKNTFKPCLYGSKIKTDKSKIVTSRKVTKSLWFVCFIWCYYAYTTVGSVL